MEQTKSLSTGYRIWAISAIIISGLVLLLSAAGTVGIWVGRNAAVSVNDTLMESVDHLAGAGREAAGRLGEGVGEIQELVVDVESSTDEIAQNVSDKGLVMTLLPPEKEKKILDKADNIGETVSSIKSAVETAFDLYKSIDDIPLINLPMPEETRAQALGNNVQEIQDKVDKLVKEIQEFRDGAASEVSIISKAAGKVNDRLEITSQNLLTLDGELDDLQTRANEWKDLFRTITMIICLVLTFIFVWTIYAMVILIRKYWLELHS